MRPPDKIFGGTPQHPFARRWYLIRKNRWLNVEINEFLMTDPVTERHNHPSFSLSIVLKGRYFEEGDDGLVERPAWSIRFRSPWTFHRINMKPGERSLSLFIQGPEFWGWGFLCGSRIVPEGEFFAGRKGSP